MYMKVFKCTSIILFIFTILINFYYGNCFHKHNSICVSFFLMQNCLPLIWDVIYGISLYAKLFIFNLANSLNPEFTLTPPGMLYIHYVFKISKCHLTFIKRPGRHLISLKNLISISYR